jgi:hypothetical protein
LTCIALSMIFVRSARDENRLTASILDARLDHGQRLAESRIGALGTTAEG